MRGPWRERERERARAHGRLGCLTASEINLEDRDTVSRLPGAKGFFYVLMCHAQGGGVHAPSKMTTVSTEAS